MNETRVATKVKDRFMGYQASFVNEEEIRLQFKDKNNKAKVVYKEDRSKNMTAETRDEDLGLLRFDIEDNCEIHLPISLSFRQYKLTHYYYSFLDCISNTGGLVAIAKVVIAIVVPLRVYFFMQALAELIKRKNEIEMQLLILKNILEYLPDIKQIIIKKIEKQTGFDHSHY